MRNGMHKLRATKEGEIMEHRLKGALFNDDLFWFCCCFNFIRSAAEYSPKDILEAWRTHKEAWEETEEVFHVS
jgi:hypothetical protein